MKYQKKNNKELLLSIPKSLKQKEMDYHYD